MFENMMEVLYVPLKLKVICQNRPLVFNYSHGILNISSKYMYNHFGFNSFRKPTVFSRH